MEKKQKTKADLIAKIEQLENELKGLRLNEQQINEENQKLNQFFESTSEGLIISDENGIIQMVNTKAEDILLYDKEELIGQNVDFLVPTDSAKLHEDERSEYIKKPEPRNMGKGRYLKGVRKDRVEIPLEIGLNHTEINGKTYIISIITEITERIRLEKAIKESEEKWQFGIEGKGDGFWDWEIITNDVIFSKQWKNMLGYSEKEVENSFNSWENLVHPDDIEAAFEDINKHLDGETQVYQNTHRLLCKDGSYKWILSRGKIFSRDDEGKPERMIGTHTDVTESKKAQVALKESESKLKEINESLKESELRWKFAIEGKGDGLWDLKPLTGELFLSTQFKNMLGYTEEELPNEQEKWLEIVHPDDREPSIEEYNRHFKGETPVFEHEHRALHKNGKYVWVLSRGKVVRWTKDGQPERVIGTYTDIDFKRKAREKLKKSEARLNEAQRIAKIGNWELDFQTNALSWSDEIYNIFDLDIEKFEPSYDTFLSTIHPDDRELVNNAFQESVRTKKPYDIVHRLLMQDGRIKYAHELATAYYNEDGEPIRALGTVQDITDVKEAEQKLKKSEARLNEAQKIAHVGNFELDFHTNALYWSVEVYNIFEMENIGEPDFEKFLEIIHPEDIDVVHDAYSFAQSARFPYDFVHRIQLADGRVKYIQQFGKTIFESGQAKKFIGTIQDITELKKAEEALIKSQEELEHANNTKDKFFSIIAHDLKNPLGAFRDITKLLVDSYEDMTKEENLEFLTLMKDSAKQVFDLLENLLQWSRSQTGKLQFDPIKFEFSNLINANIGLLKMHAEKKSIELFCDSHGEIYGYGDANMITTVIRNLASNAIKFTPDDGEIHINAVNSGDFVEVSVRDNGIGIDEKSLDKLFRIDVHHSTKGTSNEGGTGLGLVLCKEFVEKNNGKIWVESSVGEGTTFKFTVPKEEG